MLQEHDIKEKFISKKRFRIVTFFGTRPEAIKLAPVIKELEKYSSFIEQVVVVSAQHRQMLDQVLDSWKIVPDYDMDIMTENQSLFSLTANLLTQFEEVLLKVNPDLVLVQGDTTSTFVGSLAAYYLKIPVGHIEAGLRTQHKYSPFPEEMNRRMTGALADIHFAPTKQAQNNLLSEGIHSEKICVTGNTAIDALLFTLKNTNGCEHFLFKKLDSGKKTLLVTAHRRENFGEPLKEICDALKELVKRNHDLEIVFPVHYNPNVRKIVNSTLSNLERTHLIDPVDYETLVCFLDKSHLVLTDSGGIQEEAPSLGKPVLILRDTTERPEGVEAGCAKLVGTNKSRIVEETMLLLASHEAYEKMATPKNPYGDGKAAKRIADFIFKKFINQCI